MKAKAKNNNSQSSTAINPSLNSLEYYHMDFLD